MTWIEMINARHGVSVFKGPHRYSLPGRCPRPAAAAWFAASLMIAGCSSQGSEPAVPPLAVDQQAAKFLPKAIKAQGVLRVAMPTNEPPTQYYEPGTDYMTGINPDIARLIGKALGVRVEIKVTTFDAIIPGMAAGRFDMAVASMVATPEREKVMDFVDYLAMGEGVVVPKGNPLKLNSRTLCGRQVAVLAGGYQLTHQLPKLNAVCVASGRSPIDASTFKETRQAITAVISGRQEALWADSPILDLAARQVSDIEIADTFNVEPVAVALPKDSGLLPATASAMSYVIKSAAYKTVLEKYGVRSGAITSARVNSGE